MSAPAGYLVMLTILLGGTLTLLYWGTSFVMGGGLENWIDRFLADYRAGRIKVKDPLLLMVLEDED